MAKVLVIRTSSFGDVALLAPVVYSVASRYPQTRFTVMTRQAYSPIFEYLGFNVNVLPLDMRKKHKGVLGLFRMIGKAFGGRFTHVADTHGVLRSVVVSSCLRLSFTKVARIDKGREEKNLMISSNKTVPPLIHATERYVEVFEKLGFPAAMIFQNLYDFKPRVFSQLSAVVKQKEATWIGIAPFAQHEWKVYPLKKMEKVVARLVERENTKLFLFGAGKNEMTTINAWASRYPNIISHHGLLNLDREILLISYLDVMLSMDSANMHLASLVDVPVVSIWGATHPAMGFYGFGQNMSNAIQQDLNCRPCSVFGNISCRLEGEDEFMCMESIEESRIIEKVEKVLESKK